MIAEEESYKIGNLYESISKEMALENESLKKIPYQIHYSSIKNAYKQQSIFDHSDQRKDYEIVKISARKTSISISE